jgi:hypothetical protein
MGMAYLIWGVGPPCCVNKVFRPRVEDSGPDPLLAKVHLLVAMND